MPETSSTSTNHPMRPAVTPTADERRDAVVAAVEREVGIFGTAFAQVGSVTHDDASSSAKLTWDGFGEATRDLSRAIVRDGFAPDVVVAIARGGLLPRVRSRTASA
jgi:hypothetical protein